MMKCGGQSEEKLANEEIQAILTQLKGDLERHLGVGLMHLIALKYTTQVVAGTNYFIKAQIDDNKIVHIRAHKSLPHAGETVSLHSVQTDKSESEPITYF